MAVLALRPRVLAPILALVFGAPGVARAFCRAVTAQPPAGYEPSEQGCYGPAGALPLYWANACVGYSLQQNASAQVPLDEATSIAARAFSAWSTAACEGGAPSLGVVDEGPVECPVAQFNDGGGPNQHAILFRDEGWPHDDASNTLGLTTITFDRGSGAILDADMEINSHDFTLVGAGPAPAGAYDLLSVMTHEAGHFLGLAHATDRASVMYAHYQPGSTSLAPDDTAAICAVYPPDGTRVTDRGAVVSVTCDPTPLHGFTTACDAPPLPEPVHGIVTRPNTGGCTLAGTATTPPASVLAQVTVVLLVTRRRRHTSKERAPGKPRAACRKRERPPERLPRVPGRHPMDKCAPRGGR